MVTREMPVAGREEAERAPGDLVSRVRILGPGLVLAATAVGVGDLVSTMVAGQEYGFTFVWAVILAAVLKYFMTEALGRWHLASGETIISGWDSFGRWATGLVMVYLLFWSFMYGAAGPSVVGLAANAVVPALSQEAWAILTSFLALAIVWLGRYHLFENLMKTLIAAKLLTVVIVAILLTPDLGELASGLVPTVPEGSLFYAVGIAGGLGGTLALCSYGYWVRDKGWRSPTWIPVMRLDAGLGYVVTAVFGVSVLIIGAEFFYGTGQTLGEEEGLPRLGEQLGDRFGEVVRWVFLLGFWAIALASVIGTWNGMAYLFSDFLRTFRGIPDEQAERHTSERSPAFRAFLLMMTIAPIPVILTGSPVELVNLWATMGAIFLPFLSVTLLILLNSDRVGAEYRGGRFSVSNVVLGASVVLFLVLAVQAIIDAARDLF